MSGWRRFGLLAFAALALFWTGAAESIAQKRPGDQVRRTLRYPGATGHGTIPIGHNHVGQFDFSVSQTPHGVRGYFRFEELDAHHHTVAHFYLHPVLHLSVEGHTARFDGRILWHGRHARVEITVTDNGDHHDEISIHVTAEDGHDAGATLYEAGGVLTSGGIVVHSPHHH